MFGPEPSCVEIGTFPVLETLAILPKHDLQQLYVLRMQPLFGLGGLRISSHWPV